MDEIDGAHHEAPFEPASPAARIDDDLWDEFTPDEVEELMSEHDKYLEANWNPDDQETTNA